MKEITFVLFHRSLFPPSFLTRRPHLQAYVSAKKSEGFQWEVREGAKGFDVFPLADDAHHYWSGYFTSRPGLKRQVRFASNFLNAARQLEVISKVSSANLSVTTVRPSPDVGDSWTDSYVFLYIPLHCTRTMLTI